ncbi:MAG: type I restriction-modification system subunit M [Acidobacteriota bacterium]|nr:type I restriction-modification system subunit M [Acidobacteriota bacterium]
MTKEELKQLEADLWRSADTLRANSDLKSSEYSTPVLGLIFLKFADNKYRQFEDAIKAEYEELKGTRREKEISEIAIEKCGFYLPEKARYDYLLTLPESEDIAKVIKEAMQLIEQYKPELAGVLPQDEYFRLTRNENMQHIPKDLLKNFSNIPNDAEGDLLGQIYEYFLGEFALSEGQGGGEFFTPRSVVRLMVEIIEPHDGEVFDPACGSGGMFVQSAKFIEEHRKDQNDLGAKDLYVWGQEKTLENVKLAKMNLAVNGLRGKVIQGNSYYEDHFKSVGKFDYVLANPPFNVDDVSLGSVENDERFNTYGIPRNKGKVKKENIGKETVPNANYLWINLFATSLNAKGRAALVMANSASDARHSESDIRQTLIDNNLIYAMLTLPSNMFYTVTLPATLWFFDKDKQNDKILFIDARNIFTQIDRSHREFTEEQVNNIAIISKLHRGKHEEFVNLIDGYFAKGMERLLESKQHIEPISKKLTEVLKEKEGTEAVADLLEQWKHFDKLQLPETSAVADGLTVDEHNQKQHELLKTFTPFFERLHDGVKRLDKIVRQHEKTLAEKAKAEGKRGGGDRETKALKSALEELHSEVKNAEIFYKHIGWLQERFPEAKYEDVTGLCKLATPAEVREQDYSLNPGRYVGVVIEEDGRTEAEFIDEILKLNDEFETLNEEAGKLESVISQNVKAVAG